VLPRITSLVEALVPSCFWHSKANVESNNSRLIATKLQVCFLLDNSSKERREYILYMLKIVDLALIIGKNSLTSLTAAKTPRLRNFHLWGMILSTPFILSINTGLVIIRIRSLSRSAPSPKRHPKTCRENFLSADLYIIKERYKISVV
jgi:hypothetical protein